LMAASYKFGPFRLHAEGEVLFRGGEPLALGRRAVALLRTLVEQPGAVISKEALIEAAWSGIAVEENNLPVQIAALRRALQGGEHRIDTLSRRGYRFVGAVAKEMHGGIAVASMEASPLTIPDKPSIAVLPFTNLSDDPARDYFADGMTDWGCPLFLRTIGLISALSSGLMKEVVRPICLAFSVAIPKYLAGARYFIGVKPGAPRIISIGRVLLRWKSSWTIFSPIGGVPMVLGC
jgi:DNA-binding winged helix-turn-helix (wHTH) protein